MGLDLWAWRSVALNLSYSDQWIWTLFHTRSFYFLLWPLLRGLVTPARSLYANEPHPDLYLPNVILSVCSSMTVELTNLYPPWFTSEEQRSLYFLCPECPFSTFTFTALRACVCAISWLSVVLIHLEGKLYLSRGSLPSQGPLSQRSGDVMNSV